MIYSKKEALQMVEILDEIIVEAADKNYSNISQYTNELNECREFLSTYSPCKVGIVDSSKERLGKLTITNTELVNRLEAVCVRERCKDDRITELEAIIKKLQSSSVAQSPNIAFTFPSDLIVTVKLDTDTKQFLCSTAIFNASPSGPINTITPEIT